jgi:hypothetical protein
VELPLCANYIKKRGCSKSDMMLIEGNEQGWSFYCRNCKSVQIVSADGVRDRSKFELEEKRRKEQIILNRLRASRRKIFA